METSAWVFDSLVGYLHGPVWNAPLQTFIEENSLLFEPSVNGDIEDTQEYRQIHKQYRTLVDVMLMSFMDDIGITAEQFEEACHISKRELEEIPYPFHRRLFEQIWAANDYEMFVRMMTHRNVELQLQALELIEQRFGTFPDLFVPDGSRQTSRRSSVQDQDLVMKEIRRLQLEDLSDDDADVSEPRKLDIKAEKDELKTKLKCLNETQNEVQITSENTQSEGYKVSIKQKITDEDLQERQKYLKRQRDKLITLKKQIREKQLDSTEEGSQAITRPKSAKAAKSVLAGEPLKSVENDKVMEMRRALIDRIKAEVVDK